MTGPARSPVALALYRESAMAETPRDARDRARTYKEQQESGAPAAPTPPKKTRSEAEFRDAVSQAIEDAMRQGEFDNLRGRGKPLNLERDPFTPEGHGLAYDIMKNNDVPPAWLGNRAEVQREIERWRGGLQATAARLAADGARAGTGPTQETWQRRLQAQRDTLRTELEALNRRIRDVNLQQPLVTMEIFMLRLEEELRRAGWPEA
jgi:DnaJ homolog subfamily C member 28